VKRSRIALVLSAACLVATCLAVGCGGGGEKVNAPNETAEGDEGAAKQALTNYAAAIAANDPATACGHMTKTAQQAAEEAVPNSSSCEDAHRTVLAALGTRREELADQLTGDDFAVKIDGDTAELTSDESPGKALRLRREGGDWKLDQNTLTFRRK
jgi:hypothetical protein